MLKAFDLEREGIFEAINTSYKELQAELARLQQKIKEEQLPVLVIFEGWDASGKGTLINELIQELDPRGYKVEVFHESTEEEKRKPFLWRFWQKIPRKGEIMIFDRSWYRELVDDLPSKSNKYKLDVDEHIDVEIKLDELDLTSTESKATYAQIKEYILEKFNLKISTLYIAQIKKKCGIVLREHYNKSKKGKQVIPQCTPEKEEAIMDTLRHFKMI